MYLPPHWNIPKCIGKLIGKIAKCLFSSEYFIQRWTATRRNIKLAAVTVQEASAPKWCNPSSTVLRHHRRTLLYHRLKQHEKETLNNLIIPWLLLPQDLHGSVGQQQYKFHQQIQAHTDHHSIKESNCSTTILTNVNNSGP